MRVPTTDLPEHSSSAAQTCLNPSQTEAKLDGPHEGNPDARSTSKTAGCDLHKPPGKNRNMSSSENQQGKIKHILKQMELEEGSKPG